MAHTNPHDTDPALTAAADTIELWLEQREQDEQRAAERERRRAIRNARFTTRSGR